MPEAAEEDGMVEVVEEDEREAKELPNCWLVSTLSLAVAINVLVDAGPPCALVAASCTRVAQKRRNVWKTTMSRPSRTPQWRCK